MSSINTGKVNFVKAMAVDGAAERIRLYKTPADGSYFYYRGVTHSSERVGVAKALLLLYGPDLHLTEWLRRNELPSDDFFKLAGENNFKLIIAE